METGEKFHRYKKEVRAAKSKEKYQESIYVPNESKLFLKVQNQYHWRIGDIYVVKQEIFCAYTYRRARNSDAIFQ